MSEDRQGPTNGKRTDNYGELLVIVTHPAFRIGFLDAQLGRDFDHDRILDRIEQETPATALARIGWPRRHDRATHLFGASTGRTRRSVELAQYRYEEGRLAVIDKGLRCKAWGHPDYPPAAVQKYIWQRHDGAGT